MTEALGRVHIVQGDAFALAGSDYDLASMHFVAESVTEDPDEFDEFCAAFVATVRPGGHLVAAFMENMDGTSSATARAGRAYPWTARPWHGCSARSPRISGSRGSTPTRVCPRTATPGWC